MAKHWRKKYEKKHGLTWEESNRIQRDLNEGFQEYLNRVTTNFGADGIPKDTYYDALYYGPFENKDGSINELYEASKDEVRMFVILSCQESVYIKDEIVLDNNWLTYYQILINPRKSLGEKLIEIKKMQRGDYLVRRRNY